MRAGTARRTFRLPAALARCEVRAATVVADRLEVLFVPDPDAWGWTAEDRSTAMSDDRAARRAWARVRDGWHGLAAGDAASCPGCPVCALTEQAGRLDPATTAHLQAAAGHLAAAGRELLAALGRAGDRAARARRRPGRRRRHGGRRPAPRTRPARPATAWTKIPVSTAPTDEEHS